MRFYLRGWRRTFGDWQRGLYWRGRKHILKMQLRGGLADSLSGYLSRVTAERNAKARGSDTDEG